MHLLTPDDLVTRCAGDLDQETYEALESVWPAAYHAVTGLLEDIEAGRVSERTSVLDMPLGYLVSERATRVCEQCGEVFAGPTCVDCSDGE